MSKIIQASEAHAEQIIKLRVNLLLELNKLSTEKEIKAIEEATYTYFIQATKEGSLLSYCIEQDGILVSTSGLLFFQRHPTPKNLSGKEAYINNVYTLPEFRKQGLAHILVEACIQECKARGVQRIWLHASDEGMPMYAKFGFKKNEAAMELFL